MAYDPKAPRRIPPIFGLLNRAYNNSTSEIVERDKRIAELEAELANGKHSRKTMEAAHVKQIKNLWDMNAALRIKNSELREHLVLLKDVAREDMEVIQENIDLTTERDELRTKLERLHNLVVGWREHDWPEGFDRHTAELIACEYKRWRVSDE